MAMFVCLFVGIYVCMYVCMFVCLYVCISKSMLYHDCKPSKFIQNLSSLSQSKDVAFLQKPVII